MSVGIVDGVRREHNRARVCLLVMRPLTEDVRARRSLAALQQAGYEVEMVDTVVSGRWGRRRDLAQPRERGSLWHIETPDWRQRWHEKRGLSMFAFWWVVLLCLRSLRLLLRLSVDSYHACEISALPVCFIAACLRRKPLIYEAYEMPLHDVVSTNRTFQRRCWDHVLDLLLPHMLARCAALITVSPPIVTWLRQHYHHSHVSLVRNVPAYRAVPQSDLLRQSLHLDSRTRIALYQGYLQADRGLERLVHAAIYLPPDIVFVLMGKDRDGTGVHLEALIAANKLEKRILIAPPVPYAELLSWSASADIGLVLTPAHTTLNMYYSLPNKLFEYIMAGLPILATPLPALAEIITRHAVGRLLPTTEPGPQMIANAITALMRDESALKLYRQHAVHAAHEYCWEHEQKQLLEVYRHVLDTSTH